MEVEDVDSSDDETWIAGVSTAGDQKAEEAAEEEFIDLEAPSEGELEGEEESDDADDDEEEEGVAGLTSKLGTMKVSRNPPEEYGIGSQYPFLMYEYVDDKQKKVAIDLLVTCLPTESYKICFNESGTEILVYTTLPEVFFKTDRSNLMNPNLTSNTSKIVALDALLAKLNVDNNHEDDFRGPPQHIKLPFKCDTKIPIEADPGYFQNWEIEDGDGGSDLQYSMVLGVECESVEKPRREVAKKMHKVFRTPKKTRNYADMNNEC